MRERTILIIGSTGQLGSELVEACAKRGWGINALAHRDVEITDAAAVEALICAERPWAVVNCAAYNQVEGAERDPSAAFAINGAAAESLARACGKTSSILVHFSTDYVFDGVLGRPYSEADPALPLNIYGLSKLQGEEAIRRVHSRHCIVRLTGLYGLQRSPRGKPNFVESIIERAKAGGSICVHSDLICTPTSARQAAAAVSQLLDREAFGTFHLTNAGACSWYEFACEITRQAALPCDIVPTLHAVAAGLAVRPRYTAMSNAKIHAAGVLPLPAWQEAVGAYLRSRSL